MQERIRKYLEKQYLGVFSPDVIQKHIDDYINYRQCEYLLQKIKPFIQPGSKILDVGSGYGSFVLLANKNNFDCYGVEIESFEHEISKERAISEGVSPSNFFHGSALHLPFGNNTFDIVTFWNVLEHITDYKKAIFEAERVLKPGGVIFIIAPNYFSFRKEAHYHLPWFPLLPKNIAEKYLIVMGRSAKFLHECIYYITVFGLKRHLKKIGLKVTTDKAEKIRGSYYFKSGKVRSIVKIGEALLGKNLFAKIIDYLKLNPFVHSIDLMAKKEMEKTFSVST